MTPGTEVRARSTLPEQTAQLIPDTSNVALPPDAAAALPISSSKRLIPSRDAAAPEVRETAVAGGGGGLSALST